MQGCNVAHLRCETWVCALIVGEPTRPNTTKDTFVNSSEMGKQEIRGTLETIATEDSTNRNTAQLGIPSVFVADETSLLDCKETTGWAL